MKLTKVGLENSGAFRSLIIDELSQGLNLLLGETGSGKSTLRQGVATTLFGDTCGAFLPAQGREGRAAGELTWLIDGQEYRLRRAAGQDTDSLTGVRTGVAERSLARELGPLTASDYGTYYHLSFVTTPEIERRMVRSLVERFGVGRGAGPWTSEAEYQRWREQATERRDRLSQDESQSERLRGRRERLAAELAEAELNHRTRLADLERRLELARIELTSSESEQAGLLTRRRELELELEALNARRPRPLPAPVTPPATDLGQYLRRLYGRLDRLQGEIRRSLAVKRDVRRRLQALAAQRHRLRTPDDSLEHRQARGLRRHLLRLEQLLRATAGPLGETASPLGATAWADLPTTDPRVPAEGPGMLGQDFLSWETRPWDTASRAAAARETAAWETAAWETAEWRIEAQEAGWAALSPSERWLRIHREVLALRAELSRLATSSQRAWWLAETRDQRRCLSELQRRLAWLRRRRAARWEELQRWDPQGYELLQHGEKAFLNHARQQGHWAAREHFLGAFPSQALPLTSPAPPTEASRTDDPTLAQRIAHCETDLARVRVRLVELEPQIAAARGRYEDLAGQCRLLRDGLNLDALRRELKDVQLQLEVLDPRLRQLREDVRRDQAWWNLKYDGLTDRAAHWCRQLTAGRLTSVGVDAKQQHLFAVDAAATTRPFGNLSRDAQDLVCLSFALAVVERGTAGGHPLPLVLDDLFANLNVQQSQSVIDTLWDFISAGHQVLLLANERQISQRWLSRPLTASEQSRLAVFQFPDGAATLQRTQWPLVLRPLHLTKAVATPAEPAPSPRWPLITEQTPLAHLDLIEPEWLLVLSKHRIVMIGDLLDLDPEDLPSSLRMHGVTVGQVDRWQSQSWLLCCIPGLRPYDVRLLVGAGITEPEQLDELSASDVLRRLEMYLATEEGQRTMQRGTEEERARLHGWMNGLRDNRHSWGTRRTQRSYGNRRERWGRSRPERGPRPAELAPRVRLHEAAAVAKEVSEPEGKFTFYLNLDDSLERAPSIGPKMAERFAAANIGTVRQFLQLGAEDLVKRLKLRRLDLKTLQDWQRQARMVYRIPNLRGHDAQLLVACDIDDPESLLRHSPQELLAKVTPVAKSKEGQRILRSSPAPDLAEIQDWLDWAKHHRLLQVA